jgi:non-heme chloroperoxidase
VALAGRRQLWLLPGSWERWAALFEEAGYAPVTPV